MRPALLLIDFQRDFLGAFGLEPAPGQVVQAASQLVQFCRSHRIPVVHILTTVQREADDRMPHWKEAGVWRCVDGTEGHSTPDGLKPATGEVVIHKQYFSGFGTGELHRQLRALGCDTVILAGVHLHACVRATALGAYQNAYRVMVAEDAVASDDVLHGAITRRYLECRAVRFAPVDRLIAELTGRGTVGAGFSHLSPDDRRRELWTMQMDRRAEVGAAAEIAKKAFAPWRSRDSQQRAEILRRWGQMLLRESEALAQLIVRDIGKPITQARGEIRRSVELLVLAAEMGAAPSGGNSGPSTRYRYEPLGVVAIVTPYNNPVGIPAGKIGPALVYGNTVVWKPAPAASAVAIRVLEHGREAGIPEDVLRICIGDRATAVQLAESSDVQGVTLSGSAQAGYALQEICARRHIPYQGELGGNNAALVWDDANLEAAAEKIAEGAFGFAGQRCTANRRVIVAESSFESFLLKMERATARLAWGDPTKPETVVGPLISVGKRTQVQELIGRTRDLGLSTLVPHCEQADHAELMGRGSYFPPTIVLADDASAEIVQEESFAPVLVVQRAKDFDRAIELCNGVRQGLVGAIFSESTVLQERFLREAQAGVLKVNRATADADAASPLGGWKASGVGPAEHGPSDREFYCRVQTIYR